MLREHYRYQREMLPRIFDDACRIELGVVSSEFALASKLQRMGIARNTAEGWVVSREL